MFKRLVQQQAKAKAVQFTQRRFGHGAPGPAENPVFKAQDNTMFSADNFGPNPPNSIYGVCFQHPMNYQGNVPVSTTRFKLRDLDLHMAEYDIEKRAKTGAFSAMRRGVFFTGVGLVWATAELVESSQFYRGIEVPNGVNTHPAYRLLHFFQMQPVPIRE
eukprot:UN02750